MLPSIWKPPGIEMYEKDSIGRDRQLSRKTGLEERQLSRNSRSLLVKLGIT